MEAVKNKAIERNLVTVEQAANMSEKDIINLLFQPGFSTSEKVTDVSGRGVGLDVVKSKIESLSGEVEVKSKWGEGSTWTIRLPLTLAIIQALMVVVGGEKYAITSAMNADHIFVMDRGRLVDHGVHAELLSRCKIYQEIYASQTGGDAK